MAPSARRDLLATIQESPTTAVMASAVTSALAICAISITTNDWPKAWLAAEVLLMLARLPLLRRLQQAWGSIESPSFRWLNRLTTLWVVVLGLAALGCLKSGDLLLTVLANSLLFGLIGALTSRLAAAPRFAMLLKVLLLAPSFCGLWPDPSLWQSGLLISAVLYSILMQLLTVQNHRLLYDKIIAEHKNRALLNRDPLTGLSNRRELRSALQKLKTEAEPIRICVLYLDLDGFKAVNDQHGHPSGDQLLIEVSQRLLRLVRRDDLVCRLGGDEFLILLPSASIESAEHKANQIISELSRPIQLSPNQEVRIGVSIGIALSPDHSKNPEELVKLADQALYQAKAAGKRTYKLSGR